MRSYSYTIKGNDGFEYSGETRRDSILVVCLYIKSTIIPLLEKQTIEELRITSIIEL